MLILCEKPSVAKDFAKALGASGKKGCYVSGGTVIAYCVGHLFELCPPEAYDPKYKKWSLPDLPIIPSQFMYRKNESTKGQAALVIDLLKRHKDGEVVIATDAGREGELIARIALKEAGVKDISRFKRFWVSEALTKEVILSGIENARPLSDYDMLSAQGFARQRADWLAGMNFTRYMSIGNPPPPFSVGRVQTAVLSAVARRNDEVKNFTSEPYKELAAAVQSKDGVGIKALLENPKTGKTAFFAADFNYCTSAAEQCKNKPIDSVDVESQEKRKKPEKLLNITGLQKAAFKRFGYKPEETLDTAQALYETHKCLSYPRTPSRVMGDNNVDLFREKFDLLKAMDEPPYNVYPLFCDESLINADNKHIFDSSKLEDHHALIPLAPLPKEANEKESNVYNIVLKSFFLACMPDYVYNEKSFRFYVGPYVFVSKIREVIRMGYREAFYNDPLFDEKQNDDEELDTPFNEQNCSIASLQILDKKTLPKKEFAIDTLLAFMEHPRGNVEGGPMLAGLGTPATRAEIIKILFAREYLAEEKKKLFCTGRGRFLLGELAKDDHLSKMADVYQTTEWEDRLASDPESFLKEIIEYVRLCIKPDGNRAAFQKEALGKCPLCGKEVIETRNGYTCSGYKDDPKCNFVIWKTIAKAQVSANDCSLLLMGQQTPVKKCTGREGKPFEAAFVLEGGKVIFKFKSNK
jgi:DNA topoisomerase-3